MRIVTLKTEVAWSMVWKNFRRAILPAEIRSMWYVVIYGILPTNDRLYRIHLSDTDKCRRCDEYSVTYFNRVWRQLSCVELDSNSYSFNSMY